ncbi:PLDc N-terminal domain-containing protein [Halorubrum sp. DTA46]|uniref:PLDc N-terminal domain-containing protein n=1 Tax=Halorubrum sp. DTA46 TaxID=3402162 RepID=UPI003AAD6AB0
MSPILLQAGSAVAFLIGILSLAVHVAIILWVYSDAKGRSDQPAFLWALVAFFAPFLGLVLYWLLGRNQY